MNSPKVTSDEESCTEINMENEKNIKPTVVVTGFGPFRNFDVNPSWVVVNELKKLITPNDDFNLVIHQVPVEYNYVSDEVPKLWEKYKPMLMVHCGVSSQATSIVLESRAFNVNYVAPDVCGNLPDENCCCKCGDTCLIPKINMDLVSQEVNQCETDVIAAVSKDAGRYLCEFTFYTSLNINPSATAFIHIPPLNSPYTSQQLARGICSAVKAMLKQINC